MFKKVNWFEIEETKMYARTEKEGRIFDSEKGAVQFLNMFGKGYNGYAIVDYTLNEYHENELYIKEYIVLPKNVKLPVVRA